MPFVYETYTVQPCAAMGFAFRSADDNFLYVSNSSDLVNNRCKVSRAFEVGNYTMPVTGTLGLNPSLKQASVEITLSLF